MNIFDKVGHAFAWVYSHLVPAAETVASAAATVETAIDSPIGQFLAGLAGTVGKQAKTDGDAVLGAVIGAANATSAAAVAKALNIEDDTVAVAALENLCKTIAGLFGKPPAAPVARAS